VVVLIKDDTQRVVRKLSSHYLLNGPYDKLEAALNGGILFYKETQLRAGKYTVSAIVFDSLANQSSISNSTLTVPVADQTQLQLSSIVLLKNAERLSKSDIQASRSFRVGEVLVYPNLTQSISKSNNPELKLFLTAFAGQNAKPARLTLEVLQNGKVLGQFKSDLPAADETGRIQYLGTISISSFPPGDYELRATVGNVGSSATRSERFTLQP
jgi:hypothetical protein